MNTEITLSQAFEGYLLDAHARQLSSKTILDYTNAFRHLNNYIGDPPLNDISADDIRRFFAHLGSRRVVSGGVASRPPRVLSNKSILNIHIALSALWTWAIKEGFATHHVVRAVRPPKPEKPAIEPFSKADIEALLKACKRSQSYTRPGKQECDHARSTADRDRAMILLLLDTGVRASELCADPKRKAPGLLIQDVDQRNLNIKVMGKGDKERIVPISPRTSKAIWRYLLSRPDASTTAPLFISQRGGPLTSSGLLQLIRRLGQRAGISDAHPHRFRHTFAINFLRNGGNSLELQRLLGHSTLEMVKRYVDLAQVDLENAHRRASPVTNWRL
jgi:integrase/recombinase XerD